MAAATPQTIPPAVPTTMASPVLPVASTITLNSHPKTPNSMQTRANTQAANTEISITTPRERIRNFPRAGQVSGFPNRFDVSVIQTVRIIAGVTITVTPMASSGENSRQAKKSPQAVMTKNKNDNENERVDGVVRDTACGVSVSVLSRLYWGSDKESDSVR